LGVFSAVDRVDPRVDSGVALGHNIVQDFFVLSKRLDLHFE